jgi:ATP-dependent protease HslVU (ClpYQ) peptidase subunit
MSTVAVAKKNGYVAIGSDTLTMLGSTKESASYIENPSKIVKIGDNYIASVGHASTELILSSYFSNIKKIPSLNSTQDIFEVARGLHKSLKEKYFLRPYEEEDDPYESLQMHCLIANPSGIFGLYALRSVQEYSKFYAFGSGNKYALGAMKAVYDNSKTAEQIVRTGLQAAVEFDDATGDPLETYTIKLSNNMDVLQDNELV